MTTPGIMIVDDEIKLCRNIALKLKREGYVTYEAYDGKAAIRKLQQHPIRVVILDFMLTDMTGLEVLKKIKELSPRTRVYMLTAYGNVENAVLAMKLGASDYLNKPFDLKQLADIVRESYQSLDDVTGGVVFKSPNMQTVRELLDRIASTDAPVLLYGERGSGKTTLAKWVHDRSRNRNQPFLSLNCASMPEKLLEKELFGASGKAKAADGGTLFLDEIGSLTPLVQAHLLRLIEENRIICPDTNEIRMVNVRLITSSSQSLLALVKEGRFRDDLYYRLNLVEVEIPSLRERREDIPLLVQYKLDQLNEKYEKPLAISDELLQLFVGLPWQGNISELMNLIERMHLLKVNGALEINDLPESVLRKAMKSKEDIALQGRLYDVLEEVEERMIVDALDKTGGNQSKAAELLGISRNALIYKMKRISR
ncbi:sigma-54-dependent Fis family transcriptional regulator [Cohnella endophytica]|uniref:Sigma-54-dependent Fis family transcriptional regulator n=1 Tax=Cohnella endophytica TaxID=2419778 RepID=A0A494XD85_9BACL|nr:sigma-54 dependent transcriptional regulator [Cohnella endophytica]RKP48757.1 sigma-54-dependent Fis family transcriptional regulator [Cohnella endophytica]